MYLMNRLEFQDLFKIVIELVELCSAVLEEQLVEMLDWDELVPALVSALRRFYLLENVEVLSVYWHPSPFIFALRFSWHFLYIVSIIRATELVKIRPPNIFFNINLFIILLHLFVQICLLIGNDLLKFLFNNVNTANHFFNFWNFDVYLFDVVWNRSSLCQHWLK